MKFLITIIFICLPYQFLWAIDPKEVCYQDFIKRYKLEQQSNIHFPLSLFNACDKTISMQNNFFITALQKYNTTDTGIVSITKYLVERFMHEDVMKLECTEDISEFSEVFAIYTNAECNCMTNKNEELRRRNIQIDFGSVGILEGCLREISQDKDLTQAIKNLHPDVDKLNSAAHCQMIYAYTHCSLLQQELIKTCVNRAFANYKQEIKSKEDELAQALKRALIYDEGSVLSKFYTNSVFLKQIKEQTNKIAAQHRTLFNKLSKANLQKQVLFSFHQENGITIITFAYVSNNPQLLMQVQIKNAWNIVHDKIIADLIVLNEKQIANKEKYLNYFKDIADNPPEMKELK